MAEFCQLYKCSVDPSASSNLKIYEKDLYFDFLGLVSNVKAG